MQVIPAGSDKVCVCMIMMCVCKGLPAGLLFGPFLEERFISSIRDDLSYG